MAIILWVALAFAALALWPVPLVSVFSATWAAIIRIAWLELSLGFLLLNSKDGFYRGNYRCEEPLFYRRFSGSTIPFAIAVRSALSFVVRLVSWLTIAIISISAFWVGFAAVGMSSAFFAIIPWSPTIAVLPIAGRSGLAFF